MEVEEGRIAAAIDECAEQGPRALLGAAATVAVFPQDTEEPVLGQQQWETVHERRSRGLTISAIAREMQFDRKTVRSCPQQASWRPYSREAAASLLDEHRAWLAERAPEVNYSARILWQELRAQRGFAGSYVIVRRAVAPLRLEASVASLTQRRL